MATKRKPSAAQIAARKLFAKRAKAGVFTGARGRKRNPSSGRSSEEFAPAYEDADEERNRNPARRKRTTLARSRSGPYPSAAWNDNDREDIRASITKRNPVARMKVVARKRNPDTGASKVPSAFRIYRARDGQPHGNAVAMAATKDIAVSIARHLADGKRAAFVIVGKK